MANLFIDTRGRVKRLQKAPIDPEMVSGQKIATGERPIHTLVTPMRAATAARTTSGNITLLPARIGLRYYLEMVQLALTMAVGDTATATYVSINAGVGFAAYLGFQTLTAQSLAVSNNCRILTDDNAAVIFTLVGTATNALCVVSYQEVFTDV